MSLEKYDELTDEADKAAATDNTRYTHDEIFSRLGEKRALIIQRSNYCGVGCTFELTRLFSITLKYHLNILYSFLI